MARKYPLLFLLVLIFGCGSPKKIETPTDYEVIEKDEEFRKTIQSGGFVKLSDGYTYYEFENEAADTLLVMVHGFSVPSYIWDSTFYAAIDRGYGALRYDAFGRGYSDNPDAVYDVALYSGQLKELLDSLGITKKINLMGLSYGGRTISAFAYQYPERIQNLIYVDPAGFETISSEGSYPEMVSDQEVTEFKQSDAYKNMATGQLTDFYNPKQFVGWDKKYEEMMKYKGFVRALISTRKNSPSMEHEQRGIAQSRLPVFCLWGEHDTVVELRKVKENLNDRIPQLKLIIIPEAGHLPHMEQTDLFNAILFDQIISGKQF